MKTNTPQAAEDRNKALRAMRAAASDPHCGFRAVLRHRINAIEAHAARLADHERKLACLSM
jgi:hypothetical protein